MPWYMCSLSPGEPSLYVYEEEAVAALRALIVREKQRGHHVSVGSSGRVSFHEGAQLIDTVWVEDDAGTAILIA